MEQNKLKGTIKAIWETDVISDKFKKRIMILTTEDKYPQDVALEFTQDNVQLLNKHEVGEQVTVSFNIRSNEYKGRYYSSLIGWRIESLGEAKQVKEPKKVVVENDDLPF